MFVQSKDAKGNKPLYKGKEKGYYFEFYNKSLRQK